MPTEAERAHEAAELDHAAAWHRGDRAAAEETNRRRRDTWAEVRRERTERGR